MGCAAGDLARWLPNGTIDFMGRLDNQVLLLSCCWNVCYSASDPVKMSIL